MCCCHSRVRIYYHGAPSESDAFPESGFFDGSGQNPFSASPPYNSYTWWPCKQVLTDKADSSWFFITTDTTNITASNGLLDSVIQVSPTKKCWEWKSHHTIAFYLIAFAVGPFTYSTQYFHPTGRTDSMIVEYFNYTPNGNEILDILQLYCNLFGPYPFYDEKFGIARINLLGGMENQTIVMLGASGVECHETAHMWFGDNVTCGSWDDIMLNEGFAHWCESVWPEFSNANHDSARISICNTYEQNILSPSVPNDDTSSGYAPADTTSVTGVFIPRWIYYDKNAMMLNTLRFEINNDSLFFLALQNYQQRYATGNAFAYDLENMMTSTTGIDQTAFFNIMGSVIPLLISFIARRMGS
jgi:aminopeptidase N